MTAPAQQPAHEPEPTPDQNDLTAQVAGLLLVSASVALTAAAIYALLRRRRTRVTLQTVTVALTLATARTKHQPRTIGRTDVARAQARLESFYRAAYVTNAAQRLQTAVDVAVGQAERAAARAGTELEATEAQRVASDALQAATRRERSYEKAHEAARKRRLQAAVHVADAADAYGQTDPLGVTWLGWRSAVDDRTTPECRAADGTNFRADRPPVIGWPGTLHGGACRCRPDAPFPYAQTTDEATGMAGLTGSRSA